MKLLSIFIIKLHHNYLFQPKKEWRNIWLEKLSRLYVLKFFLSQYFGERNRPFPMEFHPKKNHGIKWWDLTYPQLCIQLFWRKLPVNNNIWTNKSSKFNNNSNSKVFNQCVLNPNIIDCIILDSSTKTTQLFNTIGCQVGQTQTSPQPVY